MHARKDVSHLSVRDLMLLDTKVVCLRGLNVAFASIFGTVQEISAKAGEASSVVEAARLLARDRGYQAVVLLFSKDKTNGKKALAFVPLENREAQELCNVIVTRMMETPGELPEDLRKNPLYETQGLLETGFQLELLKEMSPLHVYHVKGEVSRKTVLPMATYASL